MFSDDMFRLSYIVPDRSQVHVKPSKNCLGEKPVTDLADEKLLSLYSLPLCASLVGLAN